MPTNEQRALSYGFDFFVLGDSVSSLKRENKSNRQDAGSSKFQDSKGLFQGLQTAEFVLEWFGAHHVSRAMNGDDKGWLMKLLQFLHRSQARPPHRRDAGYE